MTNAYGRYREARDALDSGDVNSAERLLLESLELGAHFKTHELLGDIASLRGRGDDALKHFASAYRLNPNSDSAATRYARALYESARADDARSIIASVLERNPSYGPARELWNEWCE